MISICITCKNRSKVEQPEGYLYLFPNCIDSIVSGTHDLNVPIEIVISDWNSTDWPLEEWLPRVIDNSHLTYKVIPIDENKFSLGQGRNIAVKHAKYDILFFLDADMLLTSGVIEDSLKHVQEGRVVFPICCNQEDHSYMRDGGFGNLIISRTHYNLVGKWQEKNAWGGEDWDYFKRCEEHGFSVQRDFYQNFIHQWHPKRIGWNKKRASRATPEWRSKRRARYEKYKLIKKKRAERNKRRTRSKGRKT